MKRFSCLFFAAPLLGAIGCSSKDPPVCHATASIKLKSSVAELRSTTALAIDVLVADTGNSVDPHPLKVVVLKDGVVIKTLVDEPKSLGTVSLSFLPSAEKGLATGAYQIKANCGCPTNAASPQPAEATSPMYVARLGATRIAVKDGDGGGRVPLMYHATNHSKGNSFPIPDTLSATSIDVPTGEAELDAADGSARSFPAPWDDLETPPVDSSGAVVETGNALPVSLKVGTKPDLVFTIGTSAQGASAPQPSGLKANGLPPIRLVVDGAPAPATDTAAVTEGGEVVARLATSPVPAIDKVDLALKWHFEAKGEGGAYVTIPGGDQTATLRFYGVLGNDQGTVAPNLPWVAVVDEATKSIAGKATDAKGAQAILVQHIYEEMGLKYDRAGGASAYSFYAGDGWSSGVFSLSDFLKRSRGSIVNCTDCASILSTYANMIGAKSHYAIIGWNFSLNPILGIGSTVFGSPFTSGYMGFSYHAVTTPDATATINDATLAVDGDSDPKHAPYTKLLVQNLTGADYLTRLSPTFGSGTPDYKYNDQSTKIR